MGSDREDGFLGLTLEVRRDRRQDARARQQKMYAVPAGGPWWPAAGPLLDRRVRPHLRTNSMTQLVSQVLPSSSENACSQTGLRPGLAC